LIARKLDNTAWISTKWISETTGVPTYPTLFFGESPESIGLRIKDETCFTEIAEIFKGSNRYERVMVEDEETPVVVIGDIMTVTDKEQPQPEQPQPQQPPQTPTTTTTTTPTTTTSTTTTTTTTIILATAAA
jgi:hypothetical protein